MAAGTLTLQAAAAPASAPARFGGALVEGTDYYFGSPYRLKGMVNAVGAGTVTLFYYDDKLAGWVADSDGAWTVAAGLNETRWEPSGVAGCYAMCVSGTTGTWVPRAGLVSP